MFSTLIAQASARELWKKYYPDVSEEALRMILEIDPSYNSGTKGLDSPFGDFTRQILEWYRRNPGDFLTDDRESLNAYLYHLTDPLETYSKIRKSLPPEFNNINKFPTHKDFLKFMENTAPEYVSRYKRQKAENESVLLYEDDTWAVRIPKTYFASNYFAYCPEENGGIEANWCTAYDPRHFNHHSGGTLIMILNKESPEKSVQMYLSEDLNILKNYRDRDVDSGRVPEPVRKVIESKFDVDLEELFGFDGDKSDDESEDYQYRQIDVSVRATLLRGDKVVNGTFDADAYTSNQEGDFSNEGGDATDFVVEMFDFENGNPSELAVLSNINFAARGLLVDLGERSASTVIASTQERFPGYEVSYETFSDHEIGGTIFDLLSDDSGNPARYFQYRHPSDNGQALMREAVSFIVFWGFEDYTTDDLIVRTIVESVNRFSASPLSSVTEKVDLTVGRKKRASVIFYSDSYGGLERAIENPEFRDFLSALPKKPS